MSVLRPKTAKPPLVRLRRRTRDRHDFSALEIKIGLCSAEKNSHESLPPQLGFGGDVRCPQTGLVLLPWSFPRPPMDGCAAHPAVRRGQRRLAGRRPATDHRLPATIASGLTRRDAACPSDRSGPTTSPPLQAKAVDRRRGVGEGREPGLRCTGTAARWAVGERRPALGAGQSGSHTCKSLVWRSYPAPLRSDGGHRFIQPPQVRFNGFA